MDAPLVSILIRSMDRPTLDRAIASAAAQGYANIEIVVAAACGARHRSLPTQVAGRTIRLIAAADGSMLDRPRAANLLLEAARGEWLNFLDDDDELLPDHVSTLLAATRPMGERVLYARAVVHDRDGNPTGHCGIAGFHAQLYFQNRSLIMATMLHRSLIDEGARFDPAFPVFEDRDFFINCAGRTAFRFVDAVTSIWHAHIGESGLNHAGTNETALQAQYLPMLREKWRPLFDRWLDAPGALLFLGQHHLRHGEATDALRYLEHALRVTPGDVNALNLCGMAYLRTGQPEHAEALLQRALQILPDNAGLRDNLRLIHEARSKQ